MISVIIPAQSSAPYLPAVFQSLFDAAIDGLVSEVIIAGFDLPDATLQLVEAAGATFIKAGSGQQLRAGAEAARKPWLLLLHSDAVLEQGWEKEVRVFMAKGGTGAAAFRVRSASKGHWARVRDSFTFIKDWTLRRPGRCLALLIPAKLLESVGALVSSPPIDEAALMRRLGRDHAVMLNAAVTAGAGTCLR
jgi:glycosyltransferase involved in cell wall biosynthesis